MNLDIDRRRRTAQLLDLYGSLLTEHQRRILDLHLVKDWSYGEIATAQGVSRTAVYDLVRRSEALLEDYEGKLGLVARSEERLSDRDGLLQRLDGLQSELRELKKTVKELA